jgi:UDP-glucose 4-epimerase
MQGKELPNRIYNVSSDVIPTAHDVLTTLYKVMPAARARVGLDIPPQVSTEPQDYLDISRIREDVGWSPQFTLESMFTDYLSWLETNEY